MNDLVLPAENRRMLAKFLSVDFAALLSLDKLTHLDPEYKAAIPQMEADLKQITKALNSQETNHIVITDVISRFSQIKSFVALLEKAERYLVSEQWKPKEDWLQKLHKEVEISPGYSDLTYLPRDPNIDVMRGDLVQIINLLNQTA